MPHDTLTTVTASFAITAWDEAPTEPALPGMQEVLVRKRFAGPLEATSAARVLIAAFEEGRGYLASEVVDGTLEGRRGTFVLQHGGVDDLVSPLTFGRVVPGSATGELEGLRGDVTYVHDDQRAEVVLRYALP